MHQGTQASLPFHPRFQHTLSLVPPRSSLPFIRSTFSVISGNSSSRRFSYFSSLFSPLSTFSTPFHAPTRCSRGANRSRPGPPNPPIMARGIFLSPLRNYRPRTGENILFRLETIDPTDPGICHCGSPPERFRHSLPAIISLPFDKLAARCDPVEVSPLRLRPFS